MKIKSFVLAFLAVSIISACSNDNDNEDFPEDKNYNLYSIEWRLEEGDGEEIIEKVLPDRKVINGGSTTVTMEFSSKDQMNETSYFYSNDTKAFPITLNGTVNVPVTDNISKLSESYGHLLSSIRVPYQSEKFIIEPTTIITHSLELPPNCEGIYKSKINIKKIKASYCAHFVDEDGITTYEAKGKWIGEFYGSGASSEFIINSIE